MTYILNERSNNMNRYIVTQRTNKNGPISKYDVFDDDSLYFNVVALATFSLKSHAEKFVEMMNNG